MYFALKGRHDYELFQRDQLVKDIQLILERLSTRYDTIVIPESRCSFLRDVTQNVGNVVELKKRSKQEICSLVILTPTWRKNDKQSAIKDWDKMGEAFTINLIKSNKRKDYVPHLFIPSPQQGTVLLLDDFIMSGNTMNAMKMTIASEDLVTIDCLGIFYQL